MTKPVPPRIESPKNIIAVGGRELVILAVSAVLIVLIIVLRVGLMAKVGLAVLLVGLGLSAAFGRDRRTGRTIEENLYTLIRYFGRARFHQRGTISSRSANKSVPNGQPAARSLRRQVERPAAQPSRVRLQVRPLPLGPGLLFAVLSFSFLGMLLAWVWLGGLAEIQLWFGRGHF